jgi:hypothetical protein
MAGDPYQIPNHTAAAIRFHAEPSSSGRAGRGAHPCRFTWPRTRSATITWRRRRPSGGCSVGAVAVVVPAEGVGRDLRAERRGCLNAEIYG